MSYRRLFILVEGDDDQRFFERIIKPLLAEKYQDIRFWQYSRQKKEKTRGLLRGINRMGADYLYVRDINSAPCISTRKNAICRDFPHEISPERIQVVVREIESWYLAGLSDSESEKILKRIYTETNSLTKEQFNRLIPPKNNSRIILIQAILDNFSIEAALQKNLSFRYFLERLIPRL